MDSYFICYCVIVKTEPAKKNTKAVRLHSHVMFLHFGHHCFVPVYICVALFLSVLPSFSQEAPPTPATPPTPQKLVSNSLGLQSGRGWWPATGVLISVFLQIGIWEINHTRCKALLSPLLRTYPLSFRFTDGNHFLLLDGSVSLPLLAFHWNLFFFFFFGNCFGATCCSALFWLYMFCVDSL